MEMQQKISTGDAMNTSQLQCAVGGDANRRKISIIFHVVLLQLGENVLAVRVLAEHSDMRTDLVDEQFALRWIGNVDHTLYHVVGKLVFHHCIQCRLWPTITAYNTHYFALSNSLYNAHSATCTLLQEATPARLV